MSVPLSVLVTGANRGIGLEFVKQFADLKPNSPSTIFATYRSADSAKELLQLADKNKSIKPLKFDVRNASTDVQSLVDSVSSVVGERGLNVLLNNAGISGKWHNGLNETHDDLIEVYTVNAVGPLLLTQALLPLLKLAAKSDVGTRYTWSRSAILNMSSLMGSIEDNSSGSHYSYRMSKAAMNMSTKSLSIDLKESGILVCSLNPGWVRTDMGSSRASLSVEESVRGMIDRIRSLTEENNGRFYNYTGKELPY